MLIDAYPDPTLHFDAIADQYLNQIKFKTFTHSSALFFFLVIGTGFITFIIFGSIFKYFRKKLYLCCAFSCAFS